MKHLALLTIACLLLASCQEVDKFFKGDVIAKVEGSCLYKDDVEGLVPKGTSPEDSLKIINQYINSWATKKLLCMEAERQLPKEEKDLSADIENFRSNLMVFRYEKVFVEQRLDTLITSEELNTYYKENIGSFVYPYSLIKARYVKIKINSPNYQAIRKLFNTSDIQKVDELEKLCYNSADQYLNFDNDWIPMTLISKLVGETLEYCEEEVRVNSLVSVNAKDYSHIVFAYEMIRAGEVTPVEYNVKRIRQSIISKRKQDLILDLERNLLQDAIVNNKLKIYE